MATPEHGPHCESHHNMEKQNLRMAEFIGKTKEALVNIKEDANVLFGQNREIIKGINKLSNEITGIKIKLFGIGVIGAAMFELGMTFIKKWIHKG